jgi:hypothetical protein
VKRLSLIILVILMVMFATGCTVTINSVNTPLYYGKGLSIGVVGEVPKVREEHVRFTSLSFDELEEYDKLSSEYDAVFIMKEHVVEAAENKYAKVYKNAGIPFSLSNLPNQLCYLLLKIYPMMIYLIRFQAYISQVIFKLVKHLKPGVMGLIRIKLMHPILKIHTH